MKRRKMYLAMCLALVMAISLFAGCGKEETASSANKEKVTVSDDAGKSDDTSSVASKDGKPVTVTAMLMQSRNTTGFQNMVAKLETEENIKMDIQIIPDNQYDNLMTLKLSTGEAPDLIDYNIPQLFGMIDPEMYLEDLSGEDWVQRLKNKSTPSYNDKVYGFPFMELTGFQGLIYNVDVFNEFGLETPETWEDVLAAAEIFKSEGITPIFIPSDLWVPQIWMTSNFSRALGQDNVYDFAEKLLVNETKFTEQPKLEAVLDTYISMFDLGYVNEDYMSATIDKGRELIASGQAAMMYGSNGVANTIVEAFPEANINMCNPLMPYMDDNVVSVTPHSIGFAVNKDAAEMDTVKYILNLWSQPEYEELYFETLPGFPAFEGVDGGVLFDFMNDIQTNFVDTGKSVPEMNALLTPLKALNNSTLWVYYLDAPGKGMTGKEVLENYQEAIEKLMKENQAPGF